MPLRIALLVATLVLACTGTPPSTPGGQDGGGILPRDDDGGTDAGVQPACTGKTNGPGDYHLTLIHEGRNRTFKVHVPSSYDRSRATPLVFNFHGYTSNGDQQEQITGMSGTADQYGFIVVYADGLNSQEAGIGFATTDRSWNAGACCGPAMQINSDDVGFVTDMLTMLNDQFCIDAHRTFSTGFSNGGFLSHRLACEKAETFAAIAPVASVNGMNSCSPSRPVPILEFNGTADPLVSYDGSGLFISVAQSMSDWAQRNGCDAGSVPVSVRGDVSCDEWPNCSAGARTELCAVADGGHEWPGGMDVPAFGYNTHAISASTDIWQFFEAHPLP